MSPYDDPAVSAGEIAEYLYSQPQPRNMPRQRKTIQPEDLTRMALVQGTQAPFADKIYRLGPPKKRNVNKNVVNHCQLYHRSNGKLAGEAWWNMTNLRDSGFKLYVP